jgi:hypothetical protein
MKILFVSCYVNNSHYISMTRRTLDKYLVNTEYDYICLNDAPDISNGEENFLNICDIISESSDCFNLIKTAAKNNNFIHIKIPQEIHNADKYRPNHSSPRHIENLNWFNKNIDTIYPAYNTYDFICHIDSDAFLVKQIDLSKELNGYDMAGPFIYLNNLTQPLYYIHTGLFFINIHTVTNMKDITWDNTLGTDTGSNIGIFIRDNPQYKIKMLGSYDGYSTNNTIPNGHTIIKLDIEDINVNYTDEHYSLIDVWFDKHFYHFRAGSCFGVGSLRHRNIDRLLTYNKKFEAFTKLFA